MATASKVQTDIDAFVAAAKTLSGSIDWVRGYGDCTVGTYSISIGGLVTGEGAKLDIQVRNLSPPNYTIGLYFKDRQIARLDVGDTRHYNQGQLPDGLPSYAGRDHLHSWELNRQFVAPDKALKLHLAEPLPVSIQSFEAAFRHFCGLHNIGQLPTIPELPAKSDLFT